MLIMVNLGVKHKDLYSTEIKEAKEMDKEIVYPEISVHGKLADMMGAADLNEGELVEVTVHLKVKRHSATKAGGKTDYSMTLCVVKMGDMVQVDSDVDDDLEGEELEGEPPGALAALNSYTSDE